MRRLAGYRQAVAEAGLDPAVLRVVEGSAYDRAATIAVARDLLAAATARPACWR